MSENLFGLTVAADKGLDDLQCQRLLSENRRYQEVMLQYRCALKALESRLEILNEEFSLQHDRNPIESMKSRLKSPSSIMNKMQKRGLPLDFPTMQANKIDDAVVKAKQAAAEEMAVASGVKYLMYAGSRITSSHILDDIPMEIQQDTLPLGS